MPFYYYISPISDEGRTVIVVRTTVALGDHHDNTVLIWWQKSYWHVIPSVAIHDARSGDTMVCVTMHSGISLNI